uniref:Putative secreted peptide n=1 Tax=Anopheles braziliensis TaxID=58242 RepID=A0A2M3ZT70_9DIPT
MVPGSATVVAAAAAEVVAAAWCVSVEVVHLVELHRTSQPVVAVADSASASQSKALAAAGVPVECSARRSLGVRSASVDERPPKPCY